MINKIAKAPAMAAIVMALAYLCSGQVNACMTTITEPKLDMEVTYEDPQDLLDTPPDLSNFQVGSSVLIHLPLLGADDEWKAQIDWASSSAGTPKDPRIQLTYLEEARKDGKRRLNGLGIKALSATDAIIAITYVNASGSKTIPVRIKAHELVTTVIPRESSPLNLDESHASRKHTVSQGDDVIVQLQNPKDEKGQWVLVDNDKTPGILRSAEVVIVKGVPNTRLVIDSRDFPYQIRLQFRFKRAATGNALLDFFQFFKTSKTVWFDIDAIPVPLC